MKIMERTYKSKNGVVEKTRYAAPDRAVPRGRRKKGNTSFRKQEQNFNSAVRRLARILNCNFSHENGLLITLDYSEEALERLLGKLEPVQQGLIRSLRQDEVGSWEADWKKKNTKKMEEGGEDMQAALDAVKKAAEHQLDLWLRKLRRSAKNVKLASVTSDLCGDTGEMVRIHHHLVIRGDGLSWDDIRKAWKNGGVDIRQLRQQPDYTPVAVYMLRQVRRQPDNKKYRVSRGMEMPDTEECVVLSHAEIKPPAGARVMERSEFNIECMGQYIRYVPKKKEYRRKHTAEWKDSDGGGENGI